MVAPTGARGLRYLSTGWLKGESMPADILNRVFSALADPTRRDIVARLAEGDATVNELAQPYRMSLQAVYKHLRVLEEADLVSRPKGRQPRPVGLGAGGFDPEEARVGADRAPR